MRIGQLAANAGVATTTVRYYESIGLLPDPVRADNGYRSYGEADVERLLFVGDAQAAGLTLDEIRHVFDMKAKGLSACGHVTAMLKGRLDDVAARISRLDATRVELTRLLDRARSLDPSDCTDPTRCQTIEGRG